MANIETIALDTRYFAEVAAPGTPSAGQAVVYVKTDGKLYLKDDAGTETDLTASGSGMSNPMTTSQDIIVGGASGTPGRLAVGTEGQVLTVSSGNVAWAAASGGSSLSTGTSFPGTPSTGDRYRRSDLGYKIYYYNGTHWLSENEYSFQDFPMAGVTTSTTDYAYRHAVGSLEDVFVTTLEVTVYATTGGDASNHFTAQLKRATAGNTYSNLGSSLALYPATSSNWNTFTADIDTLLDVSTYPMGISMVLTETGTANFVIAWKVSYRLVPTT